MQIHDKFYLLKSQNHNRVIFGSANLSVQAFNNHTAQSECIVVLDDSLIFTCLLKHFQSDLLPHVKQYFSPILTGRTNSSQDKKTSDDKQISLFDVETKEKLKKDKHKPIIVVDNNTANKAKAEIIADYLSNIGHTIKPQATVFSKQTTADIVKPDDVKNAVKYLNEHANGQKISAKNKAQQDTEVISIVKENIITPKKGIPHFSSKKTIKRKVKRYVKRNIVQLTGEDSDTLALLKKAPYVIDEPLMRNIEIGNTGIELKGQDDVLMQIGHKADLNTIKEQITAIDHLVETYLKYPFGSYPAYGKKVYEAILYGFNAVFLPEIRSHMAGVGHNDEDVANFLFLGANSHTGKSTLQDAIIQMTSFDDSHIPLKID